MIIAILAAIATITLVALVPALRVPYAIGSALAIPALLYARWWIRERAWRYERRHGMICRLVMALAARRVCTCGKSKERTRSIRYRLRRR